MPFNLKNVLQPGSELKGTFDAASIHATDFTENQADMFTRRTSGRVLSIKFGEQNLDI